MSTALAIAGVTAVLRDLLNDGLINNNASGVLGNTVSVSVLPPDRVLANSGTEASQLNLFLYQVTPNAAWNGERLPAVDASGRTRLANPVLALDLHFLLSAYGDSDLHREILLGYAMQILHEHPVVTRQAIRTALNPAPDVGTSLPPALRALADCGLADQMEQVRVTLERLGTEELSKLWTATQSHYRPTAACQATVVLIESTRPARSPLPVLTRGPVDPDTKRERGIVVEAGLVPPVPTLEAVVPPGRQPVVRLDETVDLMGHHLDGTGREVVLSNEPFAIDETIAAAGSGEAARMQFAIPTARAADFPVGVYRVSARVVRPDEAAPHETKMRETNRLALVLAPKPTNLPLSAARDASGTATFTLQFVPGVRKGQTVSLLLGQLELAPEPYAAPTGTLVFVVPEARAGKHLARLRVDGIESPIIDRSATPPTFFDQRVEIT